MVPYIIVINIKLSYCQFYSGEYDNVNTYGASFYFDTININYFNFMIYRILYGVYFKKIFDSQYAPMLMYLYFILK